MATPPGQPWTPYDKAFLLAEILKQYAGPRWEFLYDVIRQNNVQPAWEDVALPPGRTISASRHALEEMGMQRSMPMPPTQPQPMSMPTTPSPFLPGPTGKRLYAGPEGSLGGPSSGREIRPKPMSIAPAGYSQPSPTEPPPKRKRGRPTKAEAQRREMAAASASPGVPSQPPQPVGEVAPLAPLMAAPTAYAYSGPLGSGPPQSSATRGPMPGPSSTSTSTMPPPPVEETKPYIPTTRLPVADMLTPSAPSHDPPGSQSGSSSGKRRRARSTTNKPEAQESPSADAMGKRPAYESPYARVDAEDTPARAAVLRHREADSTTGARSAPEESAETREGA